MSLGLNAWDEMLDLYFEGDDRTKLEWSIGAALDNGPKTILTILGRPASGKTTILRLVQDMFGVVLSADEISKISFHDDLSYGFSRRVSHSFSTKYTFLGSTEVPTLKGNPFHVTVTTSGYTTPFENLDSLVQAAHEVLDEIAKQCIFTYRELGANYYNQEEVSK